MIKYIKDNMYFAQHNIIVDSDMNISGIIFSFRPFYIANIKYNMTDYCTATKKWDT